MTCPVSRPAIAILTCVLALQAQAKGYSPGNPHLNPPRSASMNFSQPIGVVLVGKDNKVE